MKLQPSLSAYLDFLRFTAALSVLMGHMSQDGFNMTWMPLAHMSHNAVIIFFVLSGFIICRSSLDKSRGGLDFIVARMSRIYSVALPAVIYCVLLAKAIEWWRPDLISRLPGYREVHWVDLIACVSFYTESWSSWRDSGKALTLNGPYWSLSYEVWYYIIFGFFVFVRSAWRWPMVLLAGLLAGPAILVLLPVWALGAWYAARGETVPRLGNSNAWAVFVGSIALIALIKISDVDASIKVRLHDFVPGYWRLDGSQRMVTDYVVGLCILAHVHAYTCLPPTVGRFFERHGRQLATLAGFSFTLYLFHRPMTEISGKLIPGSMQSVPLAIVAMFLFLGSCWAISLVTEAQLPRWRQALSKVFGLKQRPGQSPSNIGAGSPR